jgi:uncharacterized protein with GYD domain
MDRARLDQAQRATDQFRQMNQEADDRVSLLRTELGLGMMGEQQRQRVLAIEEQRLRLQREFGPEHQAEIEAILAKVRAEQELQAQVERVRAAHQELQQFGGNVIDEIFNVDNVGHWGDAALRVLHSIEQELLTLAVINPLKNMLFGQSNPTLSTIFKALGDIGGAVAGGGGAGLSASNALHAGMASPPARPTRLEASPDRGRWARAHERPARRLDHARGRHTAAPRRQ